MDIARNIRSWPLSSDGQRVAVRVGGLSDGDRDCDGYTRHDGMTESIARNWYNLDADLFHDSRAPGQGLWLEGALSVCFRTGTLCNFSCRFCLSNSGPAGLTDSTWIPTALRELREITGPTRIVWSGGEPTLILGLARLLEYSKSLGNINVVTTNGSRPFWSWAADWLDFSIYGTDAISYQMLTGGPHCDRVWRHVELARTRTPRVSVNTILGVHPLATTVQIIERCRALGVRRVKLHRLLPLGRQRRVPSHVEILKDVSALKKSVPGDMIVSYPLTSGADQMLRGYWIVTAPGLLTNSTVRIPLDNRVRAAQAIRASGKEHAGIFLAMQPLAPGSASARESPLDL